ncbi:hypothetical protein G6F32_016055 [Rhizopus arrhizus]|nr:hypothetical protein G6F32_016055 [Rhizopus arrhizus]
MTYAVVVAPIVLQAFAERAHVGQAADRVDAQPGLLALALGIDLRIVVAQCEHGAQHQQRHGQCQQALDRQFCHRQLIGADDRHAEGQAQRGHADAHAPGLQDHRQRDRDAMAAGRKNWVPENW